MNKSSKLTEIQNLDCPAPVLPYHYQLVGVHVEVETLEELLEVDDTADDLPPAGGAVVGVQLGPAVATDEVATVTLEHSELSAVLHVTDLRGDNHGGEIKR